MEGIKVPIGPEIREKLPAAFAVLQSSNLTVHPYVYKVVLTGSRGLAGRYRDDSDIDLSLLVDADGLRSARDEENALREVLQTTLSAWEGPVELDLAAVFDAGGCGLRCFDVTAFEDAGCGRGMDCLGLYKIQKGFNGYVPGIGVDIKRIYPMITAWEKDRGD